MPNAFGPVLLGAVMGWMLYYFVRMYRIFSPKTLAATLVAFGGGPAIEALSSLLKASSSSESGYALWYAVGVGAGFFSYATWAGVITLLYVFGRIPSFPKFRIAIACGAGLDDELRQVEGIMELEDLLGRWAKGEESDDSIKRQLPAITLTQREYWKLRRSRDRLDCDKAILDRFETEGLASLLPLKAT
ncbi:MAG: hypothetical protein KF745_03780 [Phycisphaeraceae bacterium]|nr:hypothetical protein [Phycisphaeraceae bacterium]